MAALILAVYFLTSNAWCQVVITHTADSSINKYEALVREYDTAGSEHERELAQVNDEEQLAARHRSPYRTFEPRFVCLARELGDSEGAFGMTGTDSELKDRYQHHVARNHRRADWGANAA